MPFILHASSVKSKIDKYIMSDTQSAESEIQDKKKRKSKKSKQKGKEKDAKEAKQKPKKEPKKKKEGKQPAKKGAKSKQQQQKPPPRKASKSKGKKVEKTLDGQQAKELVLDYMTKQNRPYSLINIFDNLHAVVKKPVLQKILEGLCQDQRLTGKDYNKNKIYMLNQNQFNISNDQMQNLTKEMAQLREDGKDLEQEVKAMQIELKTLTMKPRYDELVKQVEDAKKEIIRLEQKMDMYGHDWQGVPQEEVEKIEKIYALSTKQAKKREKVVKEALKTWAQVLEKKLAQTADIMGVDLI